ncbi:MAG: hypothetical protein QXI33_02130 [Candidatus Pacearchaeota archaeon]
MYLAYKFERTKRNYKFTLYSIRSITEDDVLTEKVGEMINPYHQFNLLIPHNALEILINQTIILSKKPIEWKQAYPIIEGKVYMYGKCSTNKIIP